MNAPLPTPRAKLRLLLPLVLALAIGPRGALAQSGPVRSEAPAPKPVNLDFEEGELGQVPAGWRATVAAFPAETSAESPKSGKRCAVLHGSTSSTSRFGVLMQSVDAAPYRGHRLRLRAALRAEEARAQLWLRVDLAGDRTGFFDNMMDRPVTAAEWQTVEIVGDVDDDAKSLNFGLLMLGGGKTAIDAVAIEDLGKPTVIAEPARPLAERGLANLEAFSRLLGYVRHFHPSDEAAAADWDRFAIEGVRRIEAAKTPADLARELEAIFRPVAPTVRVATSRQGLATPAELSPLSGGAGDATVVQWRHKGFGGASKGGIYESERVRAPFVRGAIPAGFHDPTKPFVTDLPGGVACAVPLALFADAKGTLPHAAPTPAATPPPPAPLVHYTGNDRATRLADVALAWNVLAHFYPYFDVVQTDWRAELGRALASAATDADAEAFSVTLRRLVAALHDGHGGLSGPAPSLAAAFPVQWGWIEGRLVVTAVAPEGAQGLTPGDVVETIDGRPSLQAIESIERLTSAATPQWRRFRALRELRAGAEGSTALLAVVTPKGERRTVTLARTAAALRLEDARPENLAELRPGVVYLDLDRLTDDAFAAALAKLEHARGIVFDLRGYPVGSPDPLTHLTDTPIQSARWNVPILSDPDWTGTPGWDTEGRWDLKPAAPRLKGKIVFLTDGRAISYAESWMGIVEAYKLGEIVGETTAGTNGNINPIALPGGYRIVFTGMKVLKHDGSRHHGVGIAPTVPVPRTIRGVAEHRDEQLDRALAIAAAAGT